MREGGREGGVKEIECVHVHVGELGEAVKKEYQDAFLCTFVAYKGLDIEGR